MNRALLIVAAAALCGASGCASARYVEKSADGGIVAIPSNADFWPIKHMTAAKELMEKHVGPDYEILDQKEVVTGVTTHHNQEIKREPTFNSEVPFLDAEKHTVTNSTTSTDRTEWRIAYRRRPAPPLGLTQVGAIQPAGGVVPAGGTTTTVKKPADCKQ
jgi:hypothetical protein